MAAANERLDAVKKAGVLKEQVSLEQQATSEWNKKWAFVLDHYSICLEEAAKHGWTEEDFIKHKTKVKGSKILPEHTERPKPSGPNPVKSSGMIGWRSSKSEYSCEIFGPLYVSRRHTISPPDVPPTPRQNHIFLG